MVLIQLLLPATALASGGDAAMLALTRAELSERFSGGVTTYLRSRIEEWEADSSADIEQDDAVMVEVVTRTFDRHWWRGYAARLAGRFRQDAIQVHAVPVQAIEDADAAD